MVEEIRPANDGEVTRSSATNCASFSTNARVWSGDIVDRKTLGSKCLYEPLPQRIVGRGHEVRLMCDANVCAKVDPGVCPLIDAGAAPDVVLDTYESDLMATKSSEQHVAIRLATCNRPYNLKQTSDTATQLTGAFPPAAARCAHHDRSEFGILAGYESGSVRRLSRDPAYFYDQKSLRAFPC